MKTKIIAGITVIILASGAYALLPSESITLTAPQKVVWNKPTTDDEWAEDVKAEGFEHKHEYQLDDMKVDLSEELPKFLKEYEKYTECPQCVKWDIRKRLEAQEDFTGDIAVETDRVYQDDLDTIIWEVEKLKQSIERIDNEKRLRAIKKVNRTNNILSAKPSTEKEKMEHEELKKTIQ